MSIDIFLEASKLPCREVKGGVIIVFDYIHGVAEPMIWEVRRWQWMGG